MKCNKRVAATQKSEASVNENAQGYDDLNVHGDLPTDSTIQFHDKD